MHTKRPFRRAAACTMAILVLGSPLGCGRSDNTVQASPPNAPYGYVPPQTANRQGGSMSTNKKLALLAGAAALVYLYNKHKNAQGAGPQGKYYRSRNGRIYYRDAKGNAVWVTPPQQGVYVPAEQADVYRDAARSGNWNVTVPNSGYRALPPGPGRGF